MINSDKPFVELFSARNSNLLLFTFQLGAFGGLPDIVQPSCSSFASNFSLRGTVTGA